jgi:hypothetical protein
VQQTWSRLASGLTETGAARPQFRIFPQIGGVFAQTEKFGGGLAERIARRSDPPRFNPGGVSNAFHALPQTKRFGTFWDSIARVAEGFIETVADAGTGEEILATAGYGFADNIGP